ncbi:DNA topoisomerase, partial [Xanthomonas phaseoli]
SAPELAELVAGAEPSRRSATWVPGDDKRVNPHHGIVPTQVSVAIDSLPELERNLYLLIARAYTAQFYPAHEYLATRLVADVTTSETDTFVATGKVITEAGWRRVFDEASDDAGDDDESETTQALPAAADGDGLACRDAKRLDRQTKPPPAFTEGTLIRAMENIHRYVDDPAERELLREGDGIGTPATRAAILADLKRRGFLTAKGKAVISTPLGQALVDALPGPVKSPSLTAQYERQLRDVEALAVAVGTFVADLARFIGDQVQAAGASAPPIGGVEAGPECPTCKEGRLRRIHGSKGYFWGCSRYREGCKATFPDKRGAPDLAPPVACPTCKEGVLRPRTGAKGKFWGCSRYPECKTTFEDKRGKPDLAPKKKGAAA